MRFYTGLAFVLASLLLAAAPASAQLLAVNSGPVASAPAGNTMVLIGHVASPSGPLVGAVVSVDGKTYQKAVTNQEGEFRLTVPTTTEALRVTASYAGYRDVTTSLQYGAAATTMQLTEIEEIKVSRKQSLQKYVKIAHKQARRESREIHRD